MGGTVAGLHPDLDSAIADALVGATDQTEEFKRRLRRLIENATAGNLPDPDVRDVIELATVAPDAED